MILGTECESIGIRETEVPSRLLFFNETMGLAFAG